MRFLRAQGATEYLVLLAVVLIIALVSVALLGFFPGMASDAQITQSRAYWQSASPIAITETAALAYSATGTAYPYIRMKNTGAYPIRITGVIGADNAKVAQFATNANPICNPSAAGTFNISDYYYLAPGEEKYFAWHANLGSLCDYEIGALTAASSGTTVSASSICKNSTSAPGTLDFNSFGFEYIAYIDGQQITKRQVGKELIIKCSPAYP